ncbi:uncharacterized protein Nmag_3187 [Natrialba magadii ATCC 43099]|uniref:Uncharacterized protein n=1 Tax=Natrialba magadii (strain ATCC 43099 / DSM 3394 / CCM 3739 / CIP 104546 / IAM 13178 / JCM 8861 / NBRC 102185 / NCIMB 2190 / MS3) TaxID=547559 RepID=D3SRW3_NATMM|nr:hypothetical protein [Natrialba magadii]ADD06737.1 uncharacterized protein Nmag_3187 [Natrialba magadii ATCC 43099]ELY27827.1 hypothetical protein C500_14301 [Natrialba magadii ATCC 43099]
MSRTPTRAFHGERSNAYLSWLAIAVVLFLGIRALRAGLVHEMLFAATVVTVALVPAVVLESKRASLPWEVTGIAVVPLLVAVFAPDLWSRQLVLYAGGATIALALTLEVHALTEIRLERGLAIAFVTMVAASIAATWATLTWVQDIVAGTAVLASNTEVMWLLIAATVAGLVAGICFDLYYRHFPGEELVSAPIDGIEEDVFAIKADIDGQPPLEERLPLSRRVQYGLVQLLRLGMVAILGYGVSVFDVGAVSNAAAMLAVTFVPTVLRRRYDVPFDTGLVLWITVVVFMHSIGSFYIYDRSFWWHNLTHPLSATLVGAIGYVAIRVLDEHRDEVHLPPGLTPGFVVIFVLSFGVFWEIGEFGFDVVAGRTGLEMPLAQHGLDDTMTDIVFNTIGAIVVARWGLPYLTDVTDAVTDRLDGWSVCNH